MYSPVKKVAAKQQTAMNPTIWRVLSCFLQQLK